MFVQPIVRDEQLNVHSNASPFHPSLLCEKISHFFRTHLLNQCATGVEAGVKLFIVSPLLIRFLIALKVSKLGFDPIRAAKYTEYVKENFWEAAFVGPIREEIVFRGIVQSALEYAVEKIFPHKEVNIFSRKIKLPAVISIVATSIIFGAQHYGSGMGALHVIHATVGGLEFGILKYKFNLAASIAAHVTSNILAII